MPGSFRARGGKLMAFARGDIDGVDDEDEILDLEQEDGGDQAAELKTRAMAEPTREDLVESARIAIPKSKRHASAQPEADSWSVQSDDARGGQRGSRPFSPKQENGQKPLDDLFAGSQLGESFMKSSITTPHNEPEHVLEPIAHNGRNGQIGRNGFDHAPPRRTRQDRNQTHKPPAAFYITEDGFMGVGNASGKADLENMRDGFQRGRLNGHARPLSPKELRSELPMREIKIRRTQRARDDDQSVDEASRRGSPARRAGGGWHDQPRLREVSTPVAFSDFEEEETSHDGQEDEEKQVTPKARKGGGLGQLSLIEGSLPEASHTTHKRPRREKRRHPSPDYDDMALSSMRYEDLRNEPFDLDPAKAAVMNGNSPADDDRLSSRLERFRHQGESEQRSLFAGMPIDEWEESGDWFVDQFTELMQRLKGARHAKRQAMREFEDEAASREAAVRVRTEAIDQKLTKMKQDGQRVVGGKFV